MRLTSLWSVSSCSADRVLRSSSIKLLRLRSELTERKTPVHPVPVAVGRHGSDLVQPAAADCVDRGRRAQPFAP